MAVVWEALNGTDHYQVRTAGQSVRLYKNDVFHSQWNENRPLSGGVWDLLFLPALFLPQGSVKRVLLLGVGGGAVIRQYLSFLPIEQLVGVELDPMHLKIAKQHFGVRHSNVELIAADAIEWVRSYRGPGFDVVIEDLFTEQDGEPVRVAEATPQWFKSLRALLQPSGALIINFEDPAQLRACGPAYLAALDDDRCDDNGDDPCHRVDCRFGLTLPSYGNCVGAFLAHESQPAKLRKRLDELLERYPTGRRAAQKFRIRRICAK